jgi:signal peptidase II
MASNGDLPGPEATGPPAMYKDLVLLQLAALIFLADQFTKYLARAFLDFGESFPRYGFIRITHTQNTGSAFGLFPDQNTALILVAFLGIIILALLYRNLRPATNLLRLSLGLQMGGAAGNLLDRLLQGHVTDFVDIGPWPVFNVADSSIVTGLLLLFWLHGIPWERFGRGRQAEEIAEAARSALMDQRPSSWCPVCDGVMEPVTWGWRCSTCGVKERIEQVIDTHKPSSEISTHPAASGSDPDAVYRGGPDFEATHSYRYVDTPDATAHVEPPISQDEDGQHSGLTENEEAGAASPSNLGPGERPE